MVWWQELAAFVSAGFGGMFAWEKAHSIVGTIAAAVSIAIAVRQLLKRRTTQRELDVKSIRLGIVEQELDTKTKQLQAAEKEINSKQAKLNKIAKAAHSLEENIWELGPKENPPWFNQLWPRFPRRIITLANFKGGVGKTTISVNLAIALSKRGYRVLIIDLDYQGSLDGRFDIGRVDYSEGSGANALLLPDGRLFDTATLHILNGQFSGISVVPAFFGLASLENKLMLQWLLGRCDDDIRFRIANKLLTSEVTSCFDVIIIDTPPRLSAGTVNALCVSTDVLIPTVVDRPSTETVLGFAHTVRKFQKSCNPRLEICGVVPSLTSKAVLTDIENAMLAELNKRLANEGFSFKVLPVNVPRKTMGAVLTGLNQLYFADNNCKQVFDNLVTSLNLPAPAGATRGRYENSGISVSA